MVYLIFLILPLVLFVLQCLFVPKALSWLRRVSSASMRLNVAIIAASSAVYLAGVWFFSAGGGSALIPTLLSSAYQFLAAFVLGFGIAWVAHRIGAKRLVAVVFFGAFVGTLLAWGPAKAGWLDVTVNQRSMRVVEFTETPRDGTTRTFSIPRAYLNTAIERGLDHAPTYCIWISVAYPSMRPWAIAQGQNGQRRLAVLLKPRGGCSSGVERSIVSKIEPLVEAGLVHGRPTPEGLFAYDRPEPSIRATSILLLPEELSATTLFAYECIGARCERKPLTPVPLGYSYSISAEELPEWTEIERGVGRLVASFLGSGAPSP